MSLRVSLEQLEEIQGNISDAMTELARLENEHWSELTSYEYGEENLYDLLLRAEARVKNYISRLEEGE